MQYWSKAVVQHRHASHRKKVGHHKNARVDASLLERNSFLHLTDGEPGSTFVDKHARHLDRSMAIRVGFHDRHDVHVRSNGLSNASEVMGKLLAGHFHPRAKGRCRHRFYYRCVTAVNRFSYCAVAASQL